MFFVKFFFFFPPFFRRTQTTSSLKLKLTLRKQSGTVDGNFLRHLKKKEKARKERQRGFRRQKRSVFFFVLAHRLSPPAGGEPTGTPTTAPLLTGYLLGSGQEDTSQTQIFSPKNPPTRNKTRNKDLQVFQPRERKTSLLRHKQFPTPHPPKKRRSVALLTSNGPKNRGGEVRSLHISSYTV